MDSLGWAGLEPAQGWNENSSLGLSIPFTKLGQVSAHPNEAMNSINVLRLTGHATDGFLRLYCRARVSRQVRYDVRPQEASDG
jgi:hypothetical protein